MSKMNKEEEKAMAAFGRAVLHEQARQLDKKRERLHDDKFMKYLRKNSMVRGPADVRKEHKVGRPRPEYCELHETLYLRSRSGGLPVADHCHNTGKYRGWICASCNNGIIPAIDFLRNMGIDSDDIKSFLILAVDYVFTDGKILERRLGLPARKI